MMRKTQKWKEQTYNRVKYAIEGGKKYIKHHQKIQRLTMPNASLDSIQFNCCYVVYCQNDEIRFSQCNRMTEYLELRMKWEIYVINSHIDWMPNVELVERWEYQIPNTKNKCTLNIVWSYRLVFVHSIRLLFGLLRDTELYRI